MSDLDLDKVHLNAYAFALRLIRNFRNLPPSGHQKDLIARAGDII